MPTTNNMLPPGWAKTTIGAICQFTGGGTPSKDRADYWNGNIPWASVKDVKGMFIHETQDYITEQGLKNSASQLAKTGELIIVTRISPGESAIAAIDIAINQDLKIAKPFYPAQSTFLHYLFKAYKEEIANQARGTTVLGIRLHELSSLSINLPPLNEQNRIAAKIEALFTEIDQGIESIKLVQRQLKTYRQSILKHAFEGKLTEQWREAHADELEDVDTLLAKIKICYLQSAPAKVKNSYLINDEKLPKIPDSWCYIKAEHLSYFITKGTTPKSNEQYNNEAIPFIKVYNLTHNGKLDFSINPTFVKNSIHSGFLSRSKVYPDDILMNIVGPPLGKVSLVNSDYPEWNINQAIARFRTLSCLNNRYLMHFLLSKETIERMTNKSKATAGQANLTLEICRDIEIPMCSLTEQQEIVREIEKRFTEIDLLEKTLQASLQQAESLRQSILKAAFTGKLVEQDPADEPAEVLLHIIKN